MKERFENLLNDKNLKALTITLYFDMSAERACRDHDLSEKHKKSMIETPIEEQVEKIKKIFAEKGEIFSNEEIVSLTTKWGQSQFNWLKKEH